MASVCSTIRNLDEVVTASTPDSQSSSNLAFARAFRSVYGFGFLGLGENRLPFVCACCMYRRCVSVELINPKPPKR